MMGLRMEPERELIMLYILRVIRRETGFDCGAKEYSPIDKSEHKIIMFTEGGHRHFAFRVYAPYRTERFLKSVFGIVIIKLGS